LHHPIRAGAIFFYISHVMKKTKTEAEVIYLSKKGHEELKNKVDQLKKVDRPRISQQIADARDKGDLSENFEYHAAKEAQGYLELKISKLEESLANSRILDSSKLDSSKVGILSKVRLINKKVNKETVYTIVAESEANLKEGKISIKSLIGKGLIGKKVGEIADIQVPAGMIQFEILEISF
jgi:transcription elongation factor GreA